MVINRCGLRLAPGEFPGPAPGLVVRLGLPILARILLDAAPRLGLRNFFFDGQIDDLLVLAVLRPSPLSFCLRLGLAISIGSSRTLVKVCRQLTEELAVALNQADAVLDGLHDDTMHGLVRLPYVRVVVLFDCRLGRELLDCRLGRELLLRGFVSARLLLVLALGESAPKKKSA